MNECERTFVNLVLEFKYLKQTLRFFASHRGLRQDCDSGVDFDSAFDGLYVIELHDGLHFDASFPENQIGRFAGGDVRLKADELLSRDFFDRHRLLVSQRVLRAHDQDQHIVVEGEHFELLVLLGICDESEVDRVA